MTKYLSVQTKLTKEEIASIQKLREKMEKNGLRYKMDLAVFNNISGQVKHLLYIDGEKLTGYAVLSCFDPTELEVAIIMEQKAEIFEAIDATLKNYVKENQIKTMMIISDKQDHFMQQCLEKKKYTYNFSEYRMSLDFNKFVPSNKEKLRIEAASLEDAKIILQLENIFAQSEEDQTMSLEDIQKTIAAKENNQIVASMRIENELNCYAIYGFVVKEQVRGQGIGRQFLTQVIQELLKKEPQKIYLEVSTENEPALNLYQSVGFQIDTHFNYYLARL